MLQKSTPSNLALHLINYCATHLKEKSKQQIELESNHVSEFRHAMWRHFDIINRAKLQYLQRMNLS